MTSISGLVDAEALHIADAFGVALEQVHRDHLASLVLAALTPHTADVVFFGGTALARTHLPHGRLSEDLDLIATGDRNRTAHVISRSVSRAILRTHGRSTWTPPLASVRDTDPAILTAGGDLTLRVQLLKAAGYPGWPTEYRNLIQRYSTAPPARLRVPTLPAFVAWKTAAWHDRAAPRDLFDLWALANLGAITVSAAELFVEHGPTAAPPRSWMFKAPPAQHDWHAQLAAQTRLSVSAKEALGMVREAWLKVTGA